MYPNGMLVKATRVVALMLLLVGAVALCAQPAAASVASEVTAAIEESYTYGRENLKDMAGTTAAAGSYEFWSSGGLIQYVPAAAPLSEYEHNSLRPKHIAVVELPGGQAAVALYYVEGSFQEKGGGVGVSNYLTRVTQVMVKEGGAWKTVSAHFSPIMGGSGTTQNALD